MGEGTKVPTAELLLRTPETVTADHRVRIDGLAPTVAGSPEGRRTHRPGMRVGSRAGGLESGYVGPAAIGVTSAGE